MELVSVVFHAAAIGHLMISRVLTTRNWLDWRFHGALPLTFLDEDGKIFVELTEHCILQFNIWAHCIYGASLTCICVAWAMSFGHTV